MPSLDLFPEMPHRCDDPELRAELERDGVADFTCERCGNEFCAACQTAADDQPSLCNACWCEVSESQATEIVRASP